MTAKLAASFSPDRQAAQVGAILDHGKHKAIVLLRIEMVDLGDGVGDRFRCLMLARVFRHGFTEADLGDLGTRGTKSSIRVNSSFGTWPRKKFA